MLQAARGIWQENRSGFRVGLPACAFGGQVLSFAQRLSRILPSAMPDDAPKSTALPSIPWAALAPVITIVTGIVIAGWPSLDTPRPAAPGGVEVRSQVSQNVSARLWQDPLSVVLKEAGEGAFTGVPPSFSKLKNLSDALTAHPQATNCNDVLLMRVLMLHGSYGQIIEFRGRTRFAVLTSLWTNGYAPADSDHIGAARFARTGSSVSAAIGLEWWTLEKPPKPGDQSRPKHVLALWIDEQDADGSPIAWLDALLAVCSEAIRASEGREPAVLLAGGSETLRCISAADAQLIESFNGRIFACTTTTDDVELSVAGNGVPKLKRTLATDFDMMKSIVAELCARRVLRAGKAEESRVEEKVEKEHGTTDLGELVVDDGARVVLLAEYDTVYGRNLPLAFERALRSWQKSGDEPGKAANSKFGSVHDLLESRDRPCWLDIHGYARGFDGRLQGDPGGKPASSSDKDGGKKRGETATTPPSEATEGLNQSDYLRRLALAIEEQDRRLRKEHPVTGGVRAIGILGSDVYDKLMVLKALRTRLPETIFFTTDLDARLTDPQDWKTTRNLLIATPYDLYPDRAHLTNKPGFAPFRDSYQTSVFMGVARALGDGSGGPGEVRLFEIGRSGAVPLATSAGRKPDKLASGPMLGKWPYAAAWLGLLITLAAIVGIVASSYSGIGPGNEKLVIEGSAETRQSRSPLARRAEEWKARVWRVAWWQALRRNTWVWFLFSCLVALLAVLGLAEWGRRLPDAEPLAFADGVSLWPTVGFRILGVLLGLHLVARIRRSLAENGRALGRRFFKSSRKSPGPPPALKPFSPNSIGPQHPKGADWRARLKAWWQYYAWLVLFPRRVLDAETEKFIAQTPGSDAGPAGDSPKLNQDTEVDPLRLWIGYWLVTNRRVRRWRIGLMWLIYLAAVFCLFQWIGSPVPPARGEFAFVVEKATLILWVGVLVWLTFAVLDSLLHMTALVRRFNQGRSHWREEVLSIQPADKRDQAAGGESPQVNGHPLAKARHPDLERICYCEVLDVRLIGARTKEVGSLFLYPFLMQATGIAGRLPPVDNWSWPWSLVIVIGLNTLFVIVAMFLLRGAAEDARQQSLARMRDRLACQHGLDAEKRRKAIESAIVQVRESNEGAFAPLLQQPAIRWVLWLVSGFGAGGILQYFRDLY